MAARRPTSLPQHGSPGPLAPTVANLDSLGPDARVLIRLGGRVVQARIVGTCSDAELVAAVRRRADVLVTFVDGDHTQPVILGVLRNSIEREAAGAIATDAYVNIQSAAGICLSSGESSIELRPDGRVEIRAIDIVSVAEGTQVVVGGTVGIN